MMTYLKPARGLLWLISVCLVGHVGWTSAQTANVPQAGAPGSYRIAGTVVSKTDGHPLARAGVTVRDTKNPKNFQFVVTAEDGRFAFGGLPAGKYSLGGGKRGFISASYDQHDYFSTAIVTGAGLDTENLVLKLAPNAVITGKVLDEAGEPIRHATVSLYYDDHREGIDQIRSFRDAETDDLGSFEITPLMPGTYFLSARATPWYAIHPPSESQSPEAEGQSAPAPEVDRSLDVAYPVTYYPDVTEADSATPIPVRGGDHVQVDIHLNPVPALRVIFRVAGDGKNGFSYPRLEQPAFEGSTFVQSSGGRMISPGLLEITGVPAGRYNIRMDGAGPAVQMNGVDLSKDGEEVETSGGETMSTVKLSVRVAGEDTLPPQLAVGLRPKSRILAGWRNVDAKGVAQLDEIPAGRYEILVWGGRNVYSIAHLAAEGAEVSGHTVTVAAGSSPSVSLTLVAGSGEIQGIVKRAGKGFAGAMVVLVPKNPEGNRDLFRRDQSDLDGTFAFRDVIPGAYTVLAIENGWELDWSQPGVIAAYLKRGRTIQVSGGTGKPLNLEDAIEVQPR